MTPVRFRCEATLPTPPQRIAEQLLDLALWPTFLGYGPLPGIRCATFETRTPEVVGTRICVTNTDGSTHVEEVIEWASPSPIRLRVAEFSPPLSRLATHFLESWEFQLRPDGTRVARCFELHPVSRLTRPFLLPIASLLKRAIARHLRQMREADARAGSSPRACQEPSL